MVRQQGTAERLGCSQLACLTFSFSLAAMMNVLPVWLFVFFILGYMNMHLEERRNKYFKTTISRYAFAVGGGGSKRATTASEEHAAVHNWLEVGPGAVGTLTRMVLSDPDARITAVEANRGAAQSLKKRPELREAFTSGRLQVVTCCYWLRGVSSDQPFRW